MMKTNYFEWRSLPLWMTILALLGLAVSTYMGIMYSSNKPISCPAGGTGCETVQFSSYAHVLGIPIPWLGFTGYLAILTVLLGEKLGRLSASDAAVGLFGLTLFGFLYSAYLTYLEAFEIKAFCTWCMTSGALMTTLMVLGSIRLCQALRAEAA